ncbi:hypothetical protein V6N12_007746 [Hibiscus sabdariffa]|uniref:Uncharacterized protein n=1 Tax=Hibiscus sabdariffa TaxID=183260 RepID=A0ABR2F2P2_9ROSI
MGDYVNPVVIKTSNLEIPTVSQSTRLENNEEEMRIPVWWVQKKHELMDKMEQQGNENNTYLERTLRLLNEKDHETKKSTPRGKATAQEMASNSIG